jgi:two-component system, OmpR family, response regulator
VLWRPSDTRPRVLVVEDDDTVRRLLVEALEGEATVLGAVDVSQAVRTVIAFRPVVIVLDLLLPDERGDIIITRLRAGGQAVPAVVVVSAHPDAERIAAEIGADAFFRKPFDVGALVTTVRDLARRSTA